MMNTHLLTHPITCICDECRATYPPGRFDTSWVMRAEGGRRVTGRLPIGGASNWTFILFIDEDNRLIGDWPGFPGTRGARVHLFGDEIRSTDDPALAALGKEIPHRRMTIDRINARCLAEVGLAPEPEAEFIACEVHGKGLSALACRHVAESAEALDAVLLYSVDGDYPDLLCDACLGQYAAGNIDVVQPICSHCQQLNIYRHRVHMRTWYGAGESDRDRLPILTGDEGCGNPTCGCD